MSVARPRPPAATDAEARFDRAMDRWFRERLALDPSLATALGVHRHDSELPPGGRDHVEAQAAFWRAARTEMERFPDEELTAERAIDRDLVIHESRLHLLRLEELRQWAKVSGAAELIGEALFPLISRDFAPLDERLASVAARLEAAPRYLAESRSRVSDPVALWGEIDLESTESLPAFLDSILTAARAERADAAIVRRLEAAVTAARDALAEHADWLRREALARANGHWPIGREAFEELLARRELGASGDQILEVGETLLGETRAARDALCTDVDPTLSPAEVGRRIRSDHPPSFPEALEAYRTAISRAREFVVEHDLATLPADDRLLVLETPAFMRHLVPFAAYYDPAPFDPRPTGTYIVTPPASPQMLDEHSYAAIGNTTVHEAYPGHHLQLSAGITNPSLVRLTLPAPEFAEGWAFYTERMMKEAGYDDTPANWYMHHTDVIWRAMRIILDVQLQRGEIGVEAAVERLAAETGFERSTAADEVKSYTMAPGYFLSYLYGRHLFDELRGDLERRLGDAFSLRWFHDALIYGGTQPIAYARRMLDHQLREMGR